MYKQIELSEVGIDPKWADTIKIYPEEVTDLESFKDPHKFYIINAFGHRVYIKSSKRNIAQQVADEIYGKGFYKIRSCVRASVC